MAHAGVQLSDRFIADLLAKILGPSFYDGPRFGGIGSTVSLNPQPLPPRVAFALALADAHIQEVLSIDRFAGLLGEEAGRLAISQALQQVEEIDDICPSWPRWPRVWPPPPPVWNLGDEMASEELFLFGSRFTAAAGQVNNQELRGALAGLGEKATTLSMRSY